MAVTQSPILSTQSSSKLVDYSATDGIAVVQLQNPPANTYSYEMMLQLDQAVLEARMDENVHVIVIRGQGDKFFSAGADIPMLASVTPEFKYYFCLHANETLNRLEQTPKLIIAALNGHTVGGGLEIALACDVRIARRDAGRIGLPEVALGVLPGTGGTQRLARAIPKGKAMEMMVEGKNITFEEALELGLVNYIFDHDTFWEDVLDYAHRFLAPNKASMAVGRIKRSVQSGLNMSFTDSLALERELQQQLFQSLDAKEGLTSYVDKRVASFLGR